MLTPLWARIAAAFAALFVVAALLLGVLLGGQIDDTYTHDLRDRMLAEARALSVGANDQIDPTRPLSDTQALAARLGDILAARVTLIAADGLVFGDSEEDPALMENHSGRPEVQQASGGGDSIGYSVRHSSTLDIDMMYLAVPVMRPDAPGEIKAIVRIALPKTAVEEARAAIWRNLLGMLALVTLPIIGVALLLARGIARPLQELSRVARRFGSGDLTGRAEAKGRGEVALLAQDFNMMAERLSDTISRRTAENNQMAAVLANMTDAIITTDANGVVTAANPAARRFFGADDRRDRTLIEFTHEHELHVALKRVLEQRQQQEKLEISTARRTLVANVTAVPAADSGQPTGLVVLQDVTELRRLERVRRDFVANISHELRTPLASIKLLAETLDTTIDDDPEAAREFLGRIDVEIDRLTQMVRELLELSRIESGQVQLQLQAVSAEGMIEGAAARLSQQADRAHLTLAIETPGDRLPAVYADSHAVEQVLINLLHNAIKFTPPGGRITLSARRDQLGVAITIADTGIGIEAEDLPRLFERFYKVDKARTGRNREGGTGLGLAIAKHIVHAHGGTIWAESQKNVGSTFTFTLPLAGEQRGA